VMMAQNVRFKSLKRTTLAWLPDQSNGSF